MLFKIFEKLKKYFGFEDINFDKERKFKEVNELLNQYKNAVDELLIVSKTDPQGIITYVNDNFCNISGYSKEELIGKPHNIIRHPDMPKELFKDMWQTIKKGENWRGIIKNRKKDGSEYWVDTGIMPIKDYEGKIIEYIALRTDITEVVKAKERAQSAKKMKSMFLANMSHEIRTPLNAILGFTQLLEKNKNLDEETQKYLRIINSSANTLLKIINDILDLSKMESKNITFDNKEFNPNKVFFDIAYLFLAKAKEKNIDYKIEIDNLPECIKSDEDRLKQVLANLIGNAIKFTHENGKITLSIKVIQEDETKVKLKFSVKDSGIGISKEKQKEIFKAFSQADDSITRKFGGTGLGLTISSKIVKKLGGVIEINSIEGEQSEFYFSLEFEKCKTETEQTKKGEENIIYDLKVLVAEDDEFNQELIKAILSKWDINFDIVSNGEEAVNYVKNNNYDLILLDINMPKMSGIDALKEIKKSTNTPVIAMTANAFRDDVKNYFDIGFDDYIAKPIKLEELQKIFSKYSKKLKNSSKKDNYFTLLENTFGFDSDVLTKLIDIYLKNVEQDLKELQKAIEDKNLDTVLNLSHKIKGSSLNMKLDKIAQIAFEMEKNARNKNKDFDYKKYFDELKYLLEAWKKDIKD